MSENAEKLPYAQGNPELATGKTLRQTDPAQWKARKKVKQDKKDRARKDARKLSAVKFGRWRGGVALAKDGSKTCIIFGSPSQILVDGKMTGGVPLDYSVIGGGK